MLLKYSVHKTLAELFLIPWHISQNRYIGMAERSSTCDPQVERETPQVYSYTSRVLSIVPQSAFGPNLDRTHDRRRPGADPLVSKIAWPNAKRYVKDSIFLPPLPQDLPLATQTNRRCHLRCRLCVCVCVCVCVWERERERARGGERERGVTLSICLSHFTILSVQVYRFYEVCQGSMNQTVVCTTVRLWCTAVAIRP